MLLQRQQNRNMIGWGGGGGGAGERGCEATDYLREASVYKVQELGP